MTIRLPVNTVAVFVCILVALLFTSGCSSLPTDYEKNPSYAIQDTSNTQIGRKVVPVVDSHPGESGFYLLRSGVDAFVARAAVISKAERSLDVQYYIWHTDTTGRLLIDQLLQAADRGVRVRLLLDDLDTAGKDNSLALLDSHPNIEIRLYNPFASRGSRMLGFLTDLGRLNHRMHNKSITADNQLTIVGGRNIGNEYFGATSHAEFSDLDVLAMGPVVKDVSGMFDLYWNSAPAYPVSAILSDKKVTRVAYESVRARFSKVVEEEKSDPYIQAIRESDTLNRLKFENMKFSWGKAILVYDSPAKIKTNNISAATHLAPKVTPYVKNAKEELNIVSPYFVPGEKLVDFLGELVKSGVRVRILTNSLASNDVSLVHSGYMRYREDLLRHGVELYEFKPKPSLQNEHKKKWTGSSRASLHAKTFVIDRRLMFVGSFNVDPRSIALNTEMGVLFESSELATLLAESLDKGLVKNAYRLELISVPDFEDEFGFDGRSIQWTTQEGDKTVSYNAEPDTSLWRRFVTNFLSIFVVESFL